MLTLPEDDFGFFGDRPDLQDMRDYVDTWEHGMNVGEAVAMGICNFISDAEVDGPGECGSG